MEFYQPANDDCVYRVRTSFSAFSILAKTGQKAAILATPFFFYMMNCALIMAMLFLNEPGPGFARDHMFLGIALASGLFSLLLSYLTLNLYALRFQRLGGASARQDVVPVSFVGFELMVGAMLVVGAVLDVLLV